MGTLERLEDPFAQIDRKLDEVVGRYDEPGVRERIVKWLVAAACALGAAGLVVWMIESHRLPPANARPVPMKPVVIQILPAKP